MVSGLALEDTKDWILVVVETIVVSGRRGTEK